MIEYKYLEEPTTVGFHKRLWHSEEFEESTASEEALRSLRNIILRHEKVINRLESDIYDLIAMISSLGYVIKEINEKLDKLKFIERKINEIEEILKEREEIIVVKEISVDEAKKMVEQYIKSKIEKGEEQVSPLEISETLGIPYELSHEIFLELVKEGKLRIEE